MKKKNQSNEHESQSINRVVKNRIVKTSHKLQIITRQWGLSMGKVGDWIVVCLIDLGHFSSFLNRMCVKCTHWLVAE